MSDGPNPLRDIESEFDVGTITFDGKPAWPIIRRQVHYAIAQKTQKAVPTGGKHQRLKRAARAFWNIHRWFGHASVLIFSDSRHARRIDGVNVDYLLHGLFDLLADERLRYVEKPVPSHTPAALSANPNPVSLSTLDVAAVLLARLAPLPQIAGQDVLDHINRKYGITLNAAALLRTYLSYRKVMAFVLRRSQPKAIFLSQYYTLAHMALISAARDASIPTVEFQHGIISADHTSYNLYYDAGSPDCYPDQLWVFGSASRDALSRTGILPAQRIRVTGNAYMDFLRRNQRRKPANSAALRVAVTLQWTIEEAMIEAVVATAVLCPDVTFVLIPRQPEMPKYDRLELPTNIVIEKALSFYDAVVEADIHCTVYSTCALESLALGTPNVLLDLAGMATTHLGATLDAPATRVVPDAEAFASLLKNYEPATAAQIEAAAEPLFATDHRKKLAAALEDLNANLNVKAP